MVGSPARSADAKRRPGVLERLLRGALDGEELTDVALDLRNAGVVTPSVGESARRELRGTSRSSVAQLASSSNASARPPPGGNSSDECLENRGGRAELSGRKVIPRPPRPGARAAGLRSACRGQANRELCELCGRCRCAPSSGCSCSLVEGVGDLLARLLARPAPGAGPAPPESDRRLGEPAMQTPPLRGAGSTRRRPRRAAGGVKRTSPFVSSIRPASAACSSAGQSPSMDSVGPPQCRRRGEDFAYGRGQRLDALAEDRLQRLGTGKGRPGPDPAALSSPRRARAPARRTGCRPRPRGLCAASAARASRRAGRAGAGAARPCSAVLREA